jgi:DnaA family protein
LQAQGAELGWLDAASDPSASFDTRWQAIFLDDVQWYTAEQQQTAFNWFVNAHTHQVAVFASGTLPPADLKLREDLRTRLGWGHVFHLLHLSDAERQQVLQDAAQARGLVLSQEVVDFMLNRFSRDLSSLMQLLDQLDAFALRTQRAVTIPLIKTMLASE